MANVCLPPKAVDAFKQALVKGKINPEKLAKMTSLERRKLFTDVVGEGNAKWVNSTFETKLLLKNQKQGYLSWAKKVTGVTPEVKRDLISRIQKMDKILDPTEEKAFLQDLAETRLGIGVTVQEAKQIANMSSKLQEAAAKQKSDGTFPNNEDRLAYGRLKIAMGTYISDLKNNAEKASVKERLKNPTKEVSKLAGLSKSLTATLDNSAIFRQGWKTLWTNPRLWQKNARKTFIDIAKQLGGKDTLKEVQADIVSRPNYRKYEKMKLAIGNVEEEFPSSLPEKIPGLGRVYKASEGAYTGFLYRQRADVADKLLEIAEKSGVNINDKDELLAIGKMINSLTGRGHLGRFENGEAPAVFNNIFFSIRFLKSNIDTLTAHTLPGSKVTPFVRKQAAINILKIASGTAAILTIVNALRPGSVEWDPRSSDFGKIKVGSTKFDVTGGMGSIAVLAAQLIKNQQKSSGTGIVNDLGTDLGQQNRTDVVFNFFTNKFSPAAAAVRDFAKGEDFDGNKPTIASTAKNLFVPLPIKTATNDDPEKANQLLISIADGLGIATSGKTPERNVSKDLSKTMQAFKTEVGDEKFKQANDMYNKKYNQWLAANKSKFKELPGDEQKAVITTAKTKIQKVIYDHYGFKPPKSQQDQAVKQSKKQLLESIQ